MTESNTTWRASSIPVDIEVNALDLMMSLVHALNYDDLLSFIAELDDSVGDSVFTERLYEYFKEIHDRWEEQDNS